MKNILITGGAGFVGTNLIKELLRLNNRIICVDNLQTGKIENIQQFSNDINFTFVHNDIKQNIDYGAVDEIYNLACAASPPRYQKDPIDTLQTNFIGTSNLLEYAAKHGAAFLQASTSEIYGDPLESPQSEAYFGNVNTIGPRSCYDEGKRVAETLCYEFSKSKFVSTRIARIFNTYGPEMAKDDGRVVSNFINQALAEKDITIYGDGTQTRSLCYVTDLVQGLIKLMASNLSADAPVNLGNPNELNINEIAELIVKLTNSKSKVVYYPLPQDDPKVRQPNISKAKEILGWTPNVSLIDGLKQTIQYFQAV